MSSINYEPISAPIQASSFNASPSVLDRIRRKADESSREKHLDLPVPRYDGDVSVRYQAISPDRFADLATRTGVNGTLDGLIAACQCILVKNDSGILEPLTKDGEPVTFAYGLDEILGMDKDCTTRDVVLKLFSRVPSPHIAAGQHAARLTGWMAGEIESGQESLLGES